MPAGDTDKDKHGNRFDSTPIANGVVTFGMSCDLINYDPAEHDEFVTKVNTVDDGWREVTGGVCKRNGHAGWCKAVPWEAVLRAMRAVLRAMRAVLRAMRAVRECYVLVVNIPCVAYWPRGGFWYVVCTGGPLTCCRWLRVGVGVCQAMNFDGIIVRINPGQLEGAAGTMGAYAKPGGAQKRFNDAMDQLAIKGKAIWSSPVVQMRMGAKDALVRIKDLNCGLPDTFAYYDKKSFDEGFKKSCAFSPRVIKQNKGTSGEGIWLVWLESKR